MDDQVLIEDWLWDDDAPEESDDELPLSQSELALRKRMISIFIGSVIGVIGLMALITITVKVFSSAPTNQIPKGCLQGRSSECPSEKKPNSVPLPGGLKLKDFNSEPPAGNENKLLQKCLDGDVAACAASNSGG